MRAVLTVAAVALALVAVANAVSMPADAASADADEQVLSVGGARRSARMARLMRFRDTMEQRLQTTEHLLAEANEAIEAAQSARTPATTHAMAATTFVIGDVGSGGTRLNVYHVAAGVPTALGTCAQQSAPAVVGGLAGGPTNFDAIDSLNEAQARIDRLYAHCVASVQNLANPSVPAPANAFAVLALANANEAKHWLAQVPMYYEATAGLRLFAHRNNVQQIWDWIQTADMTWRNTVLTALTTAGAGNGYGNVAWVGQWVADAPRPIPLATRVIPGTLEGWYGFRAGVMKARALSNANAQPLNFPRGAATGLVGPTDPVYENDRAERILYIEVGGASQQIVFTVPAATQNTRYTMPAHETAFAEIGAGAMTTTDAVELLEGETEESAVARVAAEAARARVQTRAESLVGMGAEMDVSLMATDKGPMKLDVGASYAGAIGKIGLLYSKSFLGNGLDRMSAHVAKEALKDFASVQTLPGAAFGAGAASMPDCANRRAQMAANAPGGAIVPVPQHVVCIDMPCWRNGVEVELHGGALRWTTTANWPAYMNAANNAAQRPQAKILQDLSDYDIIQGLTSYGGNPRILFGTGNVEKCKEHVRRVFSGVDEHSAAYSYKRQFSEVRAALQLANADPNHRKSRVMISANPLDNGVSADRGIGVSGYRLRDWLAHTLQTKDNTPFNFNNPLVAAYFTVMLFDGLRDEGSAGKQEPAFDLHRHCESCAFHASSIKWAEGAAEFFSAFGALPGANARQIAQTAARRREYLLWRYRTREGVPLALPAATDIEDTYYGSCVETELAFGDNKSVNKHACEHTLQWDGRPCVYTLSGPLTANSLSTCRPA